MDDLISRQGAINKCRKRLYESAVNNVGYKCNADEVFVDIAENRIEAWLNELPFTQPEKSTTDEKSQLAEKKSTCDLIRRQDAIDLVQIYLNPFMKYIGSPEDTECEAYARTILQNIVDNLRVGYKTPSAQPEIIKCKDCKWWDKSEDSPFGYCMAMKHGYMSANWEIGIYRRYKGDFYCADAERRTDE